jgi:gluconate 2-dehydrogenase gamma chain
MSNASRRSLLTSVGIGGAATLVTRDAKAQEPRQLAYVFLNGEEAAFIEAAVARLIPADDKWGGAIEAAVPTYIDRQLAGAWGAGLPKRSLEARISQSRLSTPVHSGGVPVVS